MTDSQGLQPNEIYEYERARWIAAAGKRKSFTERFDAALPFLIIVVQVATFWVSATHTAAMINLIAPGNGIFGVVAFELGLVIFSLMAYRAQHTGGVVEKLWLGIEIAMTVMIILSNIAGSMTAVVNATGIKDLSFEAILNAIGSLKLTTQLGLIVGLVFAIGVPALFIGTGQAFARLILNGNSGADPMEAKWTANGFPFVYRAFFAELSKRGLKPSEAKLEARRLTVGFFGQPTRPTVIPDVMIPALPEPSKTPAAALSRRIRSRSNGNSNGQSKRIANAFDAALQAYREGLSVKDVIDRQIARKSTAYSAWQQYQEDKETQR